MSFTTHILICHRCPQRQPQCAGPCMCLADGVGEDIAIKATSGHCPKGYFEAGTQPMAAVTSDPVAIAGRRLWAELHTWPDADAAYIADFTRRIPCGDCRGRWLAVLAAHPPRFGDDWFAWTVESHNAVNAELGREAITLPDATALWSKAQA